MVTLTLLVSVISFSQNNSPKDVGKTEEKDSISLKYNFRHDQKGSLFLNNPSRVEVVYDKSINKFVIIEKVGNYKIGLPIYMTPAEYDKYKLKNDIKGYFKEKVNAVSGKNKNGDSSRKNLLPKYYVNSKFFESVFGGTEVDVIPGGQINIKIGGIYQNSENPLVSVENQSSFTFDFDQQISASIQASVGTRLKVTANYDTQSTFDFQNVVKLEYASDEDDILQTLDAGNVTFPIANSLINGSQSLFGVRADFQFGKTTVKTVVSQQNSQSKTVVAEGGSAIQEFEFLASDYDNDRHFFLSQYFRETYDKALVNYPLVGSPINITNIEVWVTNTNQNVEDYRSIVAFADIGETDFEDSSNMVNDNVSSSNPPYVNFITNGSAYQANLPTNDANILSEFLTENSDIRTSAGLTTALTPLNMSQGTDYSYLQNARQLSISEYTLNSQLGYISLNRRLNDGEVLAVAYEYTVVGASDGRTVFKVGEFSTDGINSPSNLAVKLLRSEITTTTRLNDLNEQEAFPTWKLMMKNVYALGAYPLQQDGFVFELMYRDDEVGVLQNTLQKATDDSLHDRTLMSLFNIDRLDQSQYTVDGGDGFFDYVEGITVNSANGLIYFTKAEPFGEDLREVITNTSDQDKYLFEDLYLTTKIQAKNDYQDQDKFYLRGYFKSDSSSGISLGAFNVPRGSVTVTAAGRQLVEGVDYVVDYQLGRVQILDTSLQASGAAISATVENNTLFSQQRKSFYGVDVEHKISENFIVGGTFLNVNEKPITPKVNFGSDPINNVMLGLNVDYSSEVPLFTKLANKLPNVETDVVSNISVRGNFAYLLPGTPSGIDINGAATAYLDDFEGAQIPINLGSASQWYLASTPNTQGYSGDAYNDLSINDNRAKLAWYSIDQLFYGSSSDLPSNIDNEDISRNEVRYVTYSELFPELELDATQLNLLSTLDLAYYPAERGPYNFNTTTDLPENNWGGIMRSLTTNNFEEANVEYLQFWLMDPYEHHSITEAEGMPSGVSAESLTNQVGKLVLNLGNISEDVLRDGNKQYENGLPDDGLKLDGSNVNETVWGSTPISASILYAFGTDDDERSNQDVGLDGLTDEEEKIKFPEFANLDDPAGDNFQFFRGSNLDDNNASILTRYKDYNNTQGNSPTANQSLESYPTSSTTYPDVEDINKDQTMNAVSSYFEYEVSLNSSDLVLGNNNIVDIKDAPVNLANGESRTTTWYQFRIPIKTGYTNSDTAPSDFNSIRFMRMFLTGFKIPVVLRMGELELVRGDWIRYTKVLDTEDAEYGNEIEDNTELNNFEVGVVSIEDNEESYALPPGIDREELQGTASVLSQNEQAATLKVTDLEPNKTRAIYKNLSIDMRRYETLKMFLHAEKTDDETLEDNDLVAIIRFGTDLDDNYYEVQKPLILSTVLSSPSSLQAWPEANNLEVILEELTSLKLDRESLDESLTEEYIGVDSNGLVIKVKGSPTLAQIKTVMLGVKNVSETNKSTEVWFNELRAVGFDNQGGWAANATVNANFADFADVSLTGNMSTVGFGGVESSVLERSLEEAKEYNVTTNVQLGKVLPKNWNIQVPMNYTISEKAVNPEYDPSYQDITVEDALESGSDAIKANSENSREYTKIKGISFVNVKKNRNTKSKKKPKFYDIENISGTYSFSEEYYRDYSIARYINQNLLAGLSYNFNFTPFMIEPFKNSEIFKSKNLKFIRDLNFNPVPKVLAVNTKVNRNFTQQQSRNLVEGFSEQPVLTQRNFLFDWDYTIGFDLTKSLKLNFNATNNYIYDTFGSDEEIEIYDKFLDIGRVNNYHQTLNGTYKLPISKLPYLNFITADYSYTADFDWEGSAQTLLDSGLTYEDVVGNMIQNANTHALNANIDFRKFYKNIGLTKLYAKKKRRTTNKSNKKLGVKDAQTKINKKVKLSKNASFGRKLGKGVYDILTSVKKAKISYSENNGTLLQGYTPQVGFLGRDNYNGDLAPSLGFVFGGQTDIIQKSIENNWLVTRAADETYYSKSYGKTAANKLDYNISVKPLKDLTIDVRGNNIKTTAYTQQLDFIEGKNVIEDIEGYETGNFSTSYYMLGTVFKNSDDLFTNFLSHRSIISERLSEETGLPNDANGAFLNSGQQVMLPAFLAAYSGKDPESISTGFFRNIPAPNWTLRYSGLSKNKNLKKIFSSFTLSHAYKSSYTLGGFTNNIIYDVDKNNIPDVNTSGNYQSETLLSTATLVDEFSPLISLDMKMRNSFSFKGEVRKDRSLALNFNNSTVTDIKGIEYILGLGYKIKDVKFVTQITGKKETVKGDINLRADISLRNNLTLIRTIDEDNDQITGGETLFGLKFLADYNLSKNLTTSFYYNHNTYEYAISTSYPRQSINAGFNIIYNLGN